MSKELPFFKFNVSEWLLGSISDESLRTQGLFIRACAMYWHRETDVTKNFFCKKLGKKYVEELINSGYIIEKNNQIFIEFLDEQYAELSKLKQVRSQAGKKGRAVQLGQTPNKAEGKPPAKLGHLDKDIDIDIDKDIESRKDAFKKALSPYLEKYGRELLNDFYSYWSEHNEKGKKLRFEFSKNQPFNIERRLVTWAKKEKNFAPKKEKDSRSQIEQAVERGEGAKDILKNLYNNEQTN